MTLELIDSHCHIDGSEFDDDRAAVLARARAAGVRQLVVVGTGPSLERIQRAISLAQTDPDVFAVVGVHPHDAAHIRSAWWTELARMAAHHKVVAVGETGLDYFYHHSPATAQKAAFRQHVALARAARRPLVCHVRDAHAEAAAILREENARDVGGVIHCFTGNADEARAYLDLGFHVSFSGILTFKTAAPIREAARIVPLDRILIETDAPYLAPVPQRGRRNEPAFVVHTARAVAAHKGLAVQELGVATRENTRRLFALGDH